MTLTEAEMAAAMYASNTAYDGRFYICVTSTKIFCLASCPAKKPRLQNVRFAKTREEAIAWGFRPCKRCCPDLEGGRRGYEADLVAKAQALIESRLSQVRIDELATALALSPDHLMRLFRRRTGLSIHEYVLQQRVARAQAELEAGQVPVLDVGLQVGFESPSSFYAAFGRIAGMPPGEYRRRYAKEGADLHD